MAKSNSIKNYDLIVLGSGPAGEKGAAQAAYFGKTVAIVERDVHLGGAAASTTIPSKTLRETSLTLSGLRARRLHGVDLALKRRATVQDFLHHAQNAKEAERSRVMDNMIRHNVTIFKGSGSFVDGQTIKVESEGKAPEFLKGNIILIATGSSPRRPENFPKGHRIYDSDTILQIKSIPKNMVVVGGGVIGCEYACIFSELGVDVSLIHNKEILLPFLDHDISLALEKSISKMGINLLKPESVESCNAKSDHIEIRLDTGKTIETEAVMLATGRTSSTGKLNVDAAEITPGKYGLLAVNENYQVIHPETRKPVPGIYAAGDVIGRPAEHVSPILPYGIYTIPECSMAGKTEKECKMEKIDYVAGKATYNNNARGMIIGDSDGFLKLIFEFNNDLSRPMKLLGVHVIGEIASELIHIGVSALIMGASSNLFIDTCFNYPTLGELYKYATYDAMGNRARRLNSG